MRKRREKRRAGPLSAGYDYSTPEAREETAAALFSRAKNARTAVEQDWTRCNNYYNFIHDAAAETADYCRENDLPWTPACVPEPWIMVESQIDPNVPEPEFRGRDTDLDSQKARQREYAVRYILDNNRIRDMNTRNERRLLKYGDAFWKAYWDTDMRCGIHEGDIRIRDIPVDCIFPDPAVRDGSIQDGQYLDYVYRIHKVEFCRRFRRDLERLGVEPEEILSQDYVQRAGLFDMTTAADEGDDTVQVLEHWFRQPVDTWDSRGEPVPAGTVACTIQAGGRELRYIPQYWVRTGRQNQLFPFVHYWRIQDENRFWNKSELFPILDLVDAADRKLSTAILNDAFLANDILVVEEGALAEGAELSNEPGAVIRVRPNRMGSVARLGGLHALGAVSGELSWFKEQIERANRNYETNMGKETARTTTATGLSMLRSDAQDQEDIKRADRNAGFERLFELLDWLALEFFDDGRMIYLGADPQKGREAVLFPYQADLYAQPMPAVTDLEGNTVREEWSCWPRVDVTVTAGEGVVKGKQATLQALQTLSQAQITRENWRLYAAQLEILDVPGRQQIVDDWQRCFAQPEQPAVPAAGPAVPVPAQEGGGAA